MSDPAAMAAEALRLASARPSEAATLARQALAAAGHDKAVASEAARALGLALREANELGRSTRALRQARQLAAEGGHLAAEADARVSLAFNLALAGRSAAALDELDGAEATWPDAAGLVGGQRAIILLRLGRFDDALAAFRVAISWAGGRGAKEAETKLRNNRALLLCWRGDTEEAEHDLRRARELSAEIGDDYGVAAAEHNLGWVLGRRGDVPSALAAFDRAEADYLRLGISPASLLVDRAELLLGARLIAEALRSATQATDELRRQRVWADLASANVLRSRAELLAGQADRAALTANAAARAFRRDGRVAWAVLAQSAAVQARLAAASGHPSAGLVRTLASTADALETAGWQLPALDARLTLAQLAFDRGDIDACIQAAETARPAARRGPADVQVRARHADALARLGAGDRRGAQRALGQAMRILDEHRATLGATELRAHAAAHGEDVARLGLELAVEDGRADAVLAWAEHHRAQALRFRPARPPSDPALTTTLAAIRATVADIDDAVKDTGVTPRELLVRQAELEREVNRLARSATGSGERAEAWGPMRTRALRDALGDNTSLVMFLVASAGLFAVVADGSRTTLQPLGGADRYAADVEAVAFALRRLARPGLPTTSAEAANGSLRRALDALDALLLAPLQPRVDRASVVVVPTGALHGLAWAAMPSLADRTVAVVPSTASWLDAVERRADRTTPGRVVAVAGPDLEVADEEAALVANRHAGAVLLTSATSRAADVLAAVDGARLAHFATHGRFRADNPLFSSLLVADGPLMVHDLERLVDAPETVILSACDSASSGRVAGDELLGMLAALLGLGSRAVVASVVPVPDRATARLMDDVHRSLAAGRPVAESLVAARRAALRSGNREDLVAGLAFNAYGDVLSPA